MNIAIIPARGGSKRIKNKNIKEFNGKPIIAYSIEAAMKSNCFDLIAVSTDNVSIAKIAKQHGADIVIIRSKKNSDDNASLYDAVNETISKLHEETTYITEHANVAVILATAPLLSIKTIKLAMSYLSNINFDSAISITKSHDNLVSYLVVSEKGTISKIKSDNDLDEPSQNKYIDAGQIYAFKANDLKKRQTLSGDKCRAIILKNMEAQDINTMNDWHLAEKKYHLISR